jgi:hypothetical protein
LAAGRSSGAKIDVSPTPVRSYTMLEKGEVAGRVLPLVAGDDEGAPCAPSEAAVTVARTSGQDL